MTRLTISGRPSRCSCARLSSTALSIGSLGIAAAVQNEIIKMQQEAQKQ